MDNPGYIGVTRMTGLLDELRVVANNIANVSTTGFRAENLVFAEVLAQADVDGGALAMAAPRAHYTDSLGGPLRATGNDFDLAIVGDGFFQVQTPEGPRLTRAGAFMRSAEGALVNPQGHPVLNEGGAPVQIPPGATGVVIGADGSISADGQPLDRIGLFTAAPEQTLRQEGVLFRAEEGVEPDLESAIRQGFIEGSNVNPMREMARLIELQRAYEQGQSFLDIEDQRQREAVRTLGRTA